MAQLITTISVFAFTDKFPRKFLLTLSHLLIFLVHIPFGTYFFMKEHGYDVSRIGWMPLVSLLAYCCAYNLGVGPILLTFLGELFPPKVKGLATSSLVSYNWIVAFVMTASFTTLSNTIGIGVLFWIFSGFSLWLQFSLNSS